MEFGVLGPLEVFDGDRRLAVGGAKQQIVLELLLLNANAVVPAGSLMRAVWGAGTAEHRTNLHVYIANLRRQLEPDRTRGTPPSRLLSRGTGYLLRVHPDELDLHRFHRLVDEGRAEAVGNPSAAAGKLTEALRLWRGAPLPALADGPAPPPEVDALSELRLSALEDRFELELALGAHSAVIGELELLVTEHSTRERLRGQLVLALYRAGRQAEALAVCRAWRAALADELGIDPSPDFQRLESAVLRQDATLTVVDRHDRGRSGTRGNLPVPATALLGRAREVNAVAGMLRRGGIRLVTLCGPGGVGKTRLAIQVAGEITTDFPDGVYFVGLASIKHPALILPVIAHTLGVRETSGLPLAEAIKEWLRDRRVLVVLDNFEHLLGSAPIVADLLTGGEGVHMLVTSRAVLRLHAEHRYLVEPLPLPDAVRLFEQRAAAVQPGYDADRASDSGGSTVAAICDRLDRLPLAIELAAARVGVLSLPSMLSRLARRLKLLDHGPVDLPGRHRTLRDAIGWSFDLLEPQAQAMFTRLAVFAGPFTIEAVEAITAADPLPALESLLGHSLVKRDPDQDGRVWFSVLPTIREYADELLAADPARDEVHRRHAEYYREMAEASAHLLETGEQIAVLRRLERDEDNLRAVLRWGLTTGATAVALRTAAALWHYWEMTSSFTEGRRWLEDLLAVAAQADEHLRARVCSGAGTLAFHQDDFDAALRHHREALELYRRAGDQAGMAFSLNNIGAQHLEQGDVDAAANLFEQARELTTEPRLSSFLLCNLAEVAYTRGDHHRARQLHEDALKLAGTLGDGWLTAVERYNLGVVALALREPHVAAPHFREGLTFARRLGDSSRTIECIHGLASVAAMTGRELIAARLFGAVSSLRQAFGTTPPARDKPAHDAALDGVRQRLGEKTFRFEWNTGLGLSISQAVAEALHMTA
ncbi:MAG TPA: BTAD domain-containing putative transcriptional regulator [Candidatus Limnocylindrales bacterium]|nr:BTAD domain-containing putative transcriptional regulator [Candidatus Limnocylindrales bacterium]